MGSQTYGFITVVAAIWWPFANLRHSQTNSNPRIGLWQDLWDIRTPLYLAGKTHGFLQSKKLQAFTQHEMVMRYGRVDIVINNAGILRDVSFKRMSEKDRPSCGWMQSWMMLGFFRGEFRTSDLLSKMSNLWDLFCAMVKLIRLFLLSHISHLGMVIAFWLGFIYWSSGLGSSVPGFAGPVPALPGYGVEKICFGKSDHLWM